MEVKKRHESYCCEIPFFWKPLNIRLLYELIFIGIEIAYIRAIEKTLIHI